MVDVIIDKSKISYAKELASEIANETQKFIDDYSSTSVERSVLRLYGVDGIDCNNTPLPNKVIEKITELNPLLLKNGISKIFAKAMVITNRDATTTARLLDSNSCDVLNQKISAAEINNCEETLVQNAKTIIENTKKKKEKKIDRFGLPPTPWKYLIVATGNIHEDILQAQSAVENGADIIAVIRSTAQSLLDYVPYGITTEGFGGTYATQENFKIMREALDEASEKAGRYIRLVNYSSGLCMSEIATCAAITDLDMLLNDSIYGILFRDINMKRTFIDQYFSRLICSKSNIIINTGEDNYLTTSDAIENAYTVTASQLINEALGKKANLTDDLLGLGHAFEINPKIKNSFLYEMSHALLAKKLFPNAPLKYMPPTKFKSTDIFYSHCLDTMFNFNSILTKQGIHLAGILTEAIHTPLMQDRAKSLKSINYIFNIAESLGDEIELKKDGLINKRAQTVLDESISFLEEINENSLFQSINDGKFADIKRATEGGKGLDGIFKKDANYSNPIMDYLKK